MTWLRLVVAASAISVVLACFDEQCKREKRGTLVWAERFDETDLSRTWHHLVTAWRGGNDEFQYYRNNRRNSFVKDGILHIRPTIVADEVDEETFKTGSITENGCNMEPCTSSGNGKEIHAPIYSARMTTQKSFSFKYGRVEIRAKMPRGDWIWPAIWLLPTDNTYGGWPASGEIDMVEVRANRNYRDDKGNSQGIDRFGATLHYGPRWPFNRWDLAHWEKKLEKRDFSDDFHTFQLEWTNSSISFGVDGESIGSIKPKEGFWKWGQFDKDPGGQNVWENGTLMAPFDQKFHIILNVAVGGRFFPDQWVNSPVPRPWDWNSEKPMKQFWDAYEIWKPTWDRPQMLVDHILVYSDQ